MSTNVKLTIPMIITFAIGVFLITVYYVVMPSSITAIGDEIIRWSTIITALSLGLGAIFLLRLHSKRILDRKSGEWYYSVITIVSFLIFPIAFFIYGIGTSSFQEIYMLIIGNIGTAIYGTVVFPLVGASYRAYRIRNYDSALLLISAVIVMMMNAPIGEIVWTGFKPLGAWIQESPTTGAFRGILMAAAFGLLAVGLRHIIGSARGYLGIIEER